MAYAMSTGVRMSTGLPMSPVGGSLHGAIETACARDTGDRVTIKWPRLSINYIFDSGTELRDIDRL